MKQKRKQLAEFLRKSRSVSGLTQGEVADHLGYSTPQFISNWERGLSSPPIFVLRKLADLYKVPAESMFKEILQATISQVEENLYRQFYRKGKSALRKTL